MKPGPNGSVRVGLRGEVTKLVGVGDRAHGLHEAIRDVQREDDHDPPVGIEQESSRLTVDLREARRSR